MKGISISPHILPLKPHPFTPLKRLGIPQTLIEAVENLLDFLLFIILFCGILNYYIFISKKISCFTEMFRLTTLAQHDSDGVFLIRHVILSGKILEKNFGVEESLLHFHIFHYSRSSKKKK